MSAAAPAPGRRVVLAYALPGFAFAMPTIPVYVHLPSFYADRLGLGLAVVGTVLLASRLFDVVTDPVVGWLSDRFPTRWGRRKPWIAVGAAIAGLGLVRLFMPPAAPDATHLFVWSAVLYLGWTMVAVPYTAWGAELSDDYDRRATITGGREAAMLAGILVAASLPGIAVLAGGTQSGGLALVAWVAVAAGAVTVTVMLRAVPEPAAPGRPGGPPAAPWRGVFANAPFRRLLGAWMLNGLANGIPAALLPLYLQYALHSGEAARNWLILLYFLCAIAAIPLWLRASRAFGKHRTWCWAMAIACAAFVWVPFIAAGGIAWFAIVCVVTGAALGADLALPPAMQADVLDLDRLRHGTERAGLFFALWSMATKFSLALAVGGAFWALDGIGFSITGSRGESDLFGVAVIYAWVPIAFKICAVALVWTYPLTPRRHAIIRRRLERNALKAAG